MTNKSLRILTSVDELKDTRLSVVGDISLEGLKVIMDDAEPYVNRDKDDWETLTHNKVKQSVFNERYPERTFRHLCLAPPTNFFFDLGNIIYNSVGDIFDDKVKENSVTLIINLFPYKCSRSEIVTLRNVLQMEYGFTNEYFNIRFIYKDLHEITPQYLKEEVDNFYIYNVNDWLLKNNIEDITKLKLPDKTVVTSMLLREGYWSINLDEKLTIDLPEANTTVKLPASKAVKLMTEEYIGLEVIKASYYSLVSAKTLEALYK